MSTERKAWYVIKQYTAPIPCTQANLSPKLGVMIAMSTSISLRGTVSFGWKKLFAGGDFAVSSFTGPGEVIFAPSVLGDIVTLRFTGTEEWKIGKDAYLAATSGIEKKPQSQGLTKTVFSGEGWWIYKMTGTGLLWIQSFGAIIKKDVSFASDMHIHAQNMFFSKSSARILC